MVNPFCQAAHGHPLSEEYRKKEFLCEACHTLGFGASKSCNICNFDLHDYCTTCPSEIHSPKLHPRHSMRLFFERKSTTSSALMRTCDVCGDEVDGLYYRCVAGCDLDAHPLCLELPLKIRLNVLHPEHDLLFAQHQGGTSACKICEEPCRFWWYRCVEKSCAAAKVDVHPECLVNLGMRSMRPRPTQETSQQ